MQVSNLAVSIYILYELLLNIYASMKGIIKRNVRTLLEASPDLRENDGYLLSHYRYHFTTLSAEEFIASNISGSIMRFRREIQREFPHLRGDKWTERQKHARVIASKLRSREKPEDLSEIFEPIERKLSPKEFYKKKFGFLSFFNR